MGQTDRQTDRRTDGRQTDASRLSLLVLLFLTIQRLVLHDIFSYLVAVQRLLWMIGRYFPVPGNSVLTETKHRLLPDPGLRAQRPHRHTVLGVLLDQRRRVTGTHLYRSADRLSDTPRSADPAIPPVNDFDQESPNWPRWLTAVQCHRSADRSDDDDDERRCPRDATARLLHQSDRRLDDRLPRVRVRVSHRVRRGQRDRQAAGRWRSNACRWWRCTGDRQLLRRSGGSRRRGQKSLETSCRVDGNYQRHPVTTGNLLSVV